MCLYGMNLRPLQCPTLSAGLHNLTVRSSSCPGLGVAFLSPTVVVTEGESTSLVFWSSQSGAVEFSQSDHLNRIESPEHGKPYVKAEWRTHPSGPGFL